MNIEIHNKCVRCGVGDFIHCDECGLPISLYYVASKHNDDISNGEDEIQTGIEKLYTSSEHLLFRIFRNDWHPSSSGYPFINTTMILVSEKALSDYKETFHI